MSTLADRLKEALAEKAPATQADLARACGIKSPSVNDWFSGKTKGMRGTSLIKAAAFLNVSKEWLAEGKGPKRPENDLEFMGHIPSRQLIPVAGIAQMGDNGWYDVPSTNGSEGYVEHSSRDPNAYAVRVKGESMFPAIRNGWYVVVEPNGTLSSGEYVAVALRNGKKMVKELLFETPDGYTLQSVNGGERFSIEKQDIETIHPVSAVVTPSKHKHDC